VAETSLSALRCLREDLDPTKRIHWIAGGKLKDKDLRSHLEDCLPLCASAHFFGQASEAIRAFNHNALTTSTSFSTTLREALDQALEAARPGDFLLFSPAFSSHDQFPNFEKRCQEALNWWREKRRKERSSCKNPTKGFLHPGNQRYHSEDQAEQ
jgi:UDP-N-acetylmuramoylalanine-D-glutamate ligase